MFYPSSPRRPTTCRKHSHYLHTNMSNHSPPTRRDPSHQLVLISVDCRNSTFKHIHIYYSFVARACTGSLVTACATTNGVRVRAHSYIRACESVYVYAHSYEGACTNVCIRSACVRGPTHVTIRTHGHVSWHVCRFILIYVYGHKQAL